MQSYLGDIHWQYAQRMKKTMYSLTSPYGTQAGIFGIELNDRISWSGTQTESE
jgi:hypothetical protein